MARYSKLFSNLEEILQDFISEINKSKLKNMTTDEWTVKDVLCHITYWHQYYAQQYAALAAGKKPLVFTSKGGSTRNQEGVNSLKNNSKKELITMLHAAQRSLYNSIVTNNVSGMDYTDRNHYRTEEFLEVVIGHIKRHTFQVKRAK